VEWGRIVVLIRDHRAICCGYHGPKKTNCFCIALLNGTRNCPARHGVKHPLLEDRKTFQSTRLYYHNGTKSQGIYAEPFVDIQGLSVSEVTSLLARAFASWDEWRKEAIILQEAGLARRDLFRGDFFRCNFFITPQF
jgi:hypothetical protein